MSGNPFRRSMQLQQQPPSLDTAPSSGHGGYGAASEEWLSGDHNASAASATTKTKKTVRVASPAPSPPQPSSPQPDDALVRRLSAAHHAGSPPPPASLEDDDSDSTAETLNGSLDNPAHDREDYAESTALMPGASGTQPRPESDMRASGAVHNPFERTLATMEPSGAQGAVPGENVSSAGRGPTERPGTHRTQASLDVDQFKRLLLTGSAAPTSSGQSVTAPPPKPAFGVVGDSSSSTDTSSLSRSSIFEAVHEAHQDSPRSSYEVPRLDGFQDDDSSNLVGEARKTEKKKPQPPPPRHKHNKSMNMPSRAPQTVSFDDFSPSFVSPPTTTSKPPAPQRKSSDTTKPMPPPPRPRKTSVESGTKELSSEPPAEGSTPTSQAQAQKRVPPAPPVARRRSQLNPGTRSTRSRSSSAATLGSQPEEPEFADLPAPTSHPAQSSTSISTSIKPPPPPPARRSGASANTSTSDLTATAAPPSRSSSHRSASSRHKSRLSGSALDLASTAATSATSGTATPSAPPPVPPPRRGSSKSSFDMPRPSASVLAAAGIGSGAGTSAGTSPTGSRRTSMEVRPRRVSGASERSLGVYETVEEVGGEDESGDGEQGEQGGLGEVRVEGVGEGGSGGAGGTDVLDEMEKFQREVEALRSRYGR